MKAPFYKYIIFQLFTNKNISYIADDLTDKHFFMPLEEIDSIYKDLLSTLPPVMSERLMNKDYLDISNQTTVEYLKMMNIYKMYLDHLMKKKQIEVEGATFFTKWFEDINWITSYKDIQSIVNVLMFNEESIESISAIIQFRYKKKVGVDALEFYKKIFWNTTNCSAKEALKYCPIIRNSSYVVRRMEDGECEVETYDFKNPEVSNGSTKPVYMMDTDYIKWKVGFKEGLKVPSAKDFLEKVKMDAMFKYEEALTMERAVEIDREEGEGFDGPVNITRTKRKNVEAERLRIAKGWVDVFIKADSKMPENQETDDDFFSNLRQIKMEFVNTEKIVDIRENPEMLEDIKDDIQNS